MFTSTTKHQHPREEVQGDTSKKPAPRPAAPKRAAESGTSEPFRLDAYDEKQWAVFNSRDEIVFTGPLSACEEWMDKAENQRPRSLLRSLRALLFRN